MSRIKADNSKTAAQFLKFVGVGAINALVNYLSYSAVIFFGGHYVLANIVGFTLSVLSSYLINSRFVFERDKDLAWWRVLLRLYASYAFTGLLLTNALSWLWIDVLMLEKVMSPATEQLAQFGLELTDRQLAEYVAPLINICFITPLNFVINKFWAYRKRPKREAKAKDVS